MCRIVLSIVAMSAVFLLSGCGGGHAELTGIVTYRGKPVYRGSITVVGDDKVPHIAAIGEDGTFRFDKVPIGLVKIGVLCPEPLADDGSPSSEAGKKLARAGVPAVTSDARKRWFRIPEKLGDPESSNLTVEIEGPSSGRRIELPD